MSLRGPTVGRNDSDRLLMVIVYCYLIRDNKMDDHKVDDISARRQWGKQPEEIAWLSAAPGILIRSPGST